MDCESAADQLLPPSSRSNAYSDNVYDVEGSNVLSYRRHYQTPPTMVFRNQLTYHDQTHESMTPALSVITPVRDRPRGFELCERWMKRQTFTDYEWIIVDDGDKPVTPTMGQTYIRRPPSSKLMTMRQNFNAGAKRASCDAVTLLEDDDWRGPNYLAGMMAALKSVDVAVTAGFYVYDVKQRLWKDEMQKIPCDKPPVLSFHAVFSGEAAEYFIKKMDTGLGKSRPFWAYVWEKFKVKLFYADMVAIKGITGKSWEGIRHLKPGNTRRSLFLKKDADPDGKLLANLVGREDASLLLKASK